MGIAGSLLDVDDRHRNGAAVWPLERNSPVPAPAPTLNFDAQETQRISAMEQVSEAP